MNLNIHLEDGIIDLAHPMAEIIGYTGDFSWDTTKPNGTPRKLLDVSKLNNLGWSAKTSLKEGIRKTYKWYKKYL